MKQLRCTGTYKDGGSTSWKDSSGQEYWLCNKMGEKYVRMKGKLFIGSINNKVHKLAEGHFSLNMGKKPTHYIFQ